MIVRALTIERFILLCRFEFSLPLWNAEKRLNGFLRNCLWLGNSRNFSGQGYSAGLVFRLGGECAQRFDIDDPD
jgi:hypothetical protein